MLLLVFAAALAVRAAAAPTAVSMDDLLASIAPGAVAAVRAGDVAAVTRWATRYEHGEGVRRHVDVAIALYCIAAMDDHGDAAYGLGWIYANGRGGARNDALAATWMDRAARHGDPHASRLLARLGPVPPESRATCLLTDGRPLALPLRGVPDPGRAKVVEWVTRLAPEAGIDPALALAMIEVESGFNPNARSPKDARGLMQLLPSTARRFGVANIWDPLANVRGGLAYLRWLTDRFEGAPRFILAGYNAGEGAVEKYRGVPPFRETRSYVKRVMSICKRARAGRYHFEQGPGTRKSRTRRGLTYPDPEGLVTCR